MVIAATVRTCQGPKTPSWDTEEIEACRFAPEQNGHCQTTDNASVGAIPSRHSTQVSLFRIGSSLTVGGRDVTWEALQCIHGETCRSWRVSLLQGCTCVTNFSK